MQAISSPWANWIRELQKKYVDGEGGFLEVISWDTKRGRDYQNLATLTFAIDSLPIFSQPDARKLDKWLQRTDAPEKKFKVSVENTLKAFLSIAADDQLNYCFKSVSQRLAPIEFVFIGTHSYAHSSVACLTDHKILQVYYFIVSVTYLGRSRPPKLTPSGYKPATSTETSEATVVSQRQCGKSSTRPRLPAVKRRPRPRQGAAKA
jgi:hypothetical protein